MSRWALCLIYGSPINDANETGSGSVKPDIGGMEEVMINLSANPVDAFNAFNRRAREQRPR
jgi:hypothetical protein